MNQQRDQRSILFIGGGVETLPGVLKAKEMGLVVGVSDRNPKADCVDFCDFFVQADTYNFADTMNKLDKYLGSDKTLDAVICMATDVPLTVAHVAEKFSLPGCTVKSAQIVSDKVLMKKVFHENNLPIPWYIELNDKKHFFEQIKKRKLPLVLKPVDSRGARGVLLLDEAVDLNWAYDTSLSFSPSKRVMLEEYLKGPQVSTESLVVNGVVYTIGFSDRNYDRLNQYLPHIIEDGGDLPSFLSEKAQIKIKTAVERTAHVLGITNGVIKGDMVLSENKAFIIEVAARLSGGYFCSDEIPLNTGVDFVKQAIKLALGDNLKKVDLEPIYNKAVSQRYLFPDPGVVKKVFIPEWIKENSNIKKCEIRVKVGDIIKETTHHPARAGVIIATGIDRKSAICLATKAVQNIKIITQ